VRVLFAVSAWPTQYAAMVPVGWALQALGHDVRVLCAPSQVEPVCRAGLTPVPILGGMTVEVRNRLQNYWEAADGLWQYPWLPPHPLTGQPLRSLDDFDVADYRRRVEPELARRTALSFDDAVEYARQWRPDVVLQDPASLEALLIGRVLDIPAILCLWGPIGTDEAEHMRTVPTDFSGSFPRYGGTEFDLGMVEYVIDPCPSSLEPPSRAKRLPVRFVPYNGGAAAPAWLLEPPPAPRVCVSWSTALSTICGPSTQLLPKLVDALADTDLDVIITATAQDAATVGAVRPNVRVVERLPLYALLPSCAAVVHHGGSGTTMTAIAAGVPQLAVTFATEQATTGSRLAGTGAAIHLSGHLAEKDVLRTMVEELVNVAAYRESAAALQTEARQRPSMMELVNTLEDLAR
jgi:UDP:flavonoid glycosyltransferase YjiC (YdhE family)